MTARLLREVVQTRHALQERIDSVEVKIEAGRSEVIGHLDEAYRRFDGLEREYQVTHASLTRIEQAVAEHGDR